MGRFLGAVRRGDVRALLDVLAPDVIVVADGGGVVPAARRPIRGAERVARALARGLRTARIEVTPEWINGSIGAVIHHDGALVGAVGFDVSGGRISRVYAISNPQKLAGLDGTSRLSLT